MRRLARRGDLAALEQVRIAALGKKGQRIRVDGRAGQAARGSAQGVRPGRQRRQGRGSATRSRPARADLEAAALDQRARHRAASTSRCPFAGPLADGRIHPVSQVFDEIIEIFGDMGFAVAEGPDIETDDYNFTKLNIPPEHPARQEHDTFYLHPRPGSNGSRMVLRTHTSPVQIRTMLTQKPPIRIIVPGRVYRSDSDQTHTPMFHQIEGLVIDEETHLGHLKWCLEEFCKAFFEVDDVKMRFRASHFPFTEPSMEVDIDAAAIGKPGRWLEILGSGMVHPKVIANCGLDPERYQGFAFGMGLDRIAMLKYGIPDLARHVLGRHALAAPLRLPLARRADACRRRTSCRRGPRTSS